VGFLFLGNGIFWDKDFGRILGYENEGERDWT
jgi:hypothetical protein